MFQVFQSDKLIMTVKEYFPVIFGVLKDFRVIGTVIVMIIVIEFAKFVTTYKKKPAKPKPNTFKCSIPFLSLKVWKNRNAA